ncbi:MAG: protein TolR [Alphaproteobacteria bacterium]
MGAKLAGSSRGGRRRANVMAEINVTPFVDVMLVLLIIFMVTAPLLTAGVSINLPKTNAKSLSQPDSKPLEVSIDSRGDIYLGDQRQKDIPALVEKLRAIATETQGDRVIYFRADKGVAYGRSMEVMAGVQTSGFTKIALVTENKDSK